MPATPMFSFMFLIIIALVVLAFIGLGAFAVIMIVRSNKSTDSGTCGKCGYSVTGLTEFQCPECGSDLREVGIARQTSGGGNGLLIAGLAIFGVMAMLCCGGFFTFASFSARNVAIGGPMPPPTMGVTQSGGYSMGLSGHTVTYNDNIVITFNKPAIDDVPPTGEQLANALFNDSRMSTWDLAAEDIADIELMIDGETYRVGDHAEIEDTQSDSPQPVEVEELP